MWEAWSSAASTQADAGVESERSHENPHGKQVLLGWQRRSLWTQANGAQQPADAEKYGAQPMWIHCTRLRVRHHSVTLLFRRLRRPKGRGCQRLPIRGAKLHMGMIPRHLTRGSTCAFFKGSPAAWSTSSTSFSRDRRDVIYDESRCRWINNGRNFLLSSSDLVYVRSGKHASFCRVGAVRVRMVSFSRKAGR